MGIKEKKRTENLKEKERKKKKINEKNNLKIEMIPTTLTTRQNPPVSGPLSRQVRDLRMTVGPRAVQSKNAGSQLT